MTGSIFCIVDPHKHRIRRSTLTPLFTFKAMNMAAADMANTIERAAKRLTSGLREKKPINIQQLYFCITVNQTTCVATYSDRTSYTG